MLGSVLGGMSNVDQEAKCVNCPFFGLTVPYPDSHVYDTLPPSVLASRVLIARSGSALHPSDPSIGSIGIASPSD